MSESGLIFAYVGEWDNITSDTNGPMYHVYAIDSYNGRTVWKIPIGRGMEYCHEYGGIYFSRPTGNMLVVGTVAYLIAIKNDSNQRFLPPKAAKFMNTMHDKIFDAAL